MVGVCKTESNERHTAPAHRKSTQRDLVPYANSSFIGIELVPFSLEHPNFSTDGKPFSKIAHLHGPEAECIAKVICRKWQSHLQSRWCRFQLWIATRRRSITFLGQTHKKRNSANFKVLVYEPIAKQQYARSKMVSDEQSDGHSRPQVCAPCTQTRHDFNHIAYENLSPYQNQIYLSEDACHDNIHSPRSRPTNPESPQMPATQGTLCEHEPVKAMETNTKCSDWALIATMLQCYNPVVYMQKILTKMWIFWKIWKSPSSQSPVSMLSHSGTSWPWSSFLRFGILARPGFSNIHSHPTLTQALSLISRDHNRTAVIALPWRGRTAIKHGKLYSSAVPAWGLRNGTHMNLGFHLLLEPSAQTFLGTNWRVLPPCNRFTFCQATVLHCRNLLLEEETLHNLHTRTYTNTRYSWHQCKILMIQGRSPSYNKWTSEPWIQPNC